jgi:O-antigen/teichoic acid export membrane protein
MRLRRNISWALAGNVAYVGAQALLLVFLAKLTDVGEVGAFALALAVSSPAFLFANLQLTIVLGGDVADEYPVGSYLALRFVMSACVLLSLLTFAAVGPHAPAFGYVLALLSVSKWLESLGTLFHGILVRKERVDLVARSFLLRSAGSLLAFGGTLYVTRELDLALLGLIVLNALMLVAFELPAAARICGMSSRSLIGPLLTRDRARTAWNGRMVQLLIVALPLGIYSFLDSINANLPRFFLESHHGLEAVGYYSALAYLMVAGNTVVDALGASTRPRLARSFLEDAAAFRRLLGRMVATGIACGIVGVFVAVVLGGRILALLYTPDYTEHQGTLVVLMLGGALWYQASIASHAIAAARRFKTQTAIIVVTVAGTAILSAVLVPRDGLNGAAWAFVGGAAVRLAAAGAAVLTLLFVHHGPRTAGGPVPSTEVPVA